MSKQILTMHTRSRIIPVTGGDDDMCCIHDRISYRIVVLVWSTVLLKWMPIMYEYTIGADHKVIKLK